MVLPKLSELLVQRPDFVSSDGNLHSWELFLQHKVDFRRLYFIELEKDQLRGKHAHKSLVQFFIVLKGRVNLTLETSSGDKFTFKLKDSEGILIPENIWREFYCESENAQVIVAANRPYDEKDYIRSYSEFRNLEA